MINEIMGNQLTTVILFTFIIILIIDFFYILNKQTGGD